MKTACCRSNRAVFALLILGFVIFVSITTCLLSCAGRSPERVWAQGTEWPEATWQDERPAGVGFDEGLFGAAIVEFANYAGDPHELLIIKDGRRVFHAVRYPYPLSHPHAIFSCTKSIISLLAGIALHEGMLPELDTALSFWYPQAAREGWSGMSLKHLLAMTTGVQWREDGSYGSGDSYTAMLQAADPETYFFSRQLGASPGERFQYNSGAAVLLGLILEQASGLSLEAYARDRLFGPLGIEPWYWHPLADGRGNGAAGLYLSVDDLARVGLMVARGGVWKDRRIVSGDWLNMSTGLVSDSRGSVSGQHGYGLLWWMNESGGFSARGFGGQFLLVYPEHDLVIVSTGGLFGADHHYPESILAKGILKALGTGSENDQALAAAGSAFSSAPSSSKPAVPERLPLFMREGKALVFEDGTELRLGLPDGDTVQLDWLVNGNQVRCALPLDGTYVEVDLGSFGVFPVNRAMLSLRSIYEDSITLILRRLGVAYTYIYTVKLAGNEALWSGQVSYQRQPFERYRGEIRP